MENLFSKLRETKLSFGRETKSMKEMIKEKKKEKGLLERKMIELEKKNK
jgi:hypothetical protein